MTDTNTFNFQDYTQGQTIDYGTNQVISSTQEGAQVYQENNQIDPSSYLQGDTAILQASAGLGDTGNVDYLSQNNIDTNAIFGDTITKLSQVPEGYQFQGTNTTTETNVIDGNTLFGENNAIVTNITQETQGTNIDPNSYFTNLNTTDTNAIYSQTQIIPETTATTTTTTTTTTNENYFTQPQEIQGTTTYGETQIIPSSDTNNYFSTNQTEYVQSQPQIESTDFTNYQTSGTTTDYTNYNFEATNIETSQPQQVYSTEATTTTTTTNTFSDQIPQYQITPNVIEAYPSTKVNVTHIKSENTFDTNAIPMTETQYIPSEPQFDINQFQQTYETTPVTDTTTTTTTNYNFNQPEVTYTQDQSNNIITATPEVQTTFNTTNEVISQPQVQTTFNTPNEIISQPQVQTTTYNTTNEVISQPQVQTTQSTTYNINNLNNLKQVNPVVQEPVTNEQTNIITTPTPPPVETKPQIIPINLNKNKAPSGFQLFGKLIDEDFRRGRPIYNDMDYPSKIRYYTNNQQNPIYQVRKRLGAQGNIGLSRLTPAFSYDRVGPNSVSLNPTVSQLNNNINLGRQINDINPINSVNPNLINEKINPGFDRLTKANSYDVNQQSMTPLLNNFGLNPNLNNN